MQSIPSQRLQLLNVNRFCVTKSTKHSLPFPLQEEIMEGHNETPFILSQKQAHVFDTHSLINYA